MDKEYICLSCSETFVSKSELQRCPTCGELFCPKCCGEIANIEEYDEAMKANE